MKHRIKGGYRHGAIGIVFASAILLTVPAGASGKVVRGTQAFPRAEAARRLDDILRRVRSSNAPDLVGGSKWSALIARHREAIESCTTHETFATAVNRLIADSDISHFHYYTDDDWLYWHLQSAFGDDGPKTEVAHIGIIPEQIEGRWFVRGVLEDSPAVELDIRVGDEVVSVDGLPFAPVASFRRQAGQTLQLRLQRRPGVIHEVEVTPRKESLYAAMQRSVTKSIARLEHDGFTLGYMHGWTVLGRGREYEELAAIQDEVDGLILDYRDGLGGNWAAAERFLLGTDDVCGAGGPPQWVKPVVILTGDGTRSAKEVVVSKVKRARRAPLVGEPTPGHVISVGSLAQIGDDGLLMLPGHKFSLEGKPTLPDYPVDREIRYCAGADPQMDFAKKLLAKMAREQRRVSKTHSTTPQDGTR